MQNQFFAYFHYGGYKQRDARDTPPADFYIRKKTGMLFAPINTGFGVQQYFAASP